MIEAVYNSDKKRIRALAQNIDWTVFYDDFYEKDGRHNSEGLLFTLCEEGKLTTEVKEVLLLLLSLGYLPARDFDFLNDFFELRHQRTYEALCETLPDEHRVDFIESALAVSYPYYHDRMECLLDVDHIGTLSNLDGESVMELLWTEWFRRSEEFFENCVDGSWNDFLLCSQKIEESGFDYIKHGQAVLPLMKNAYKDCVEAWGGYSEHRGILEEFRSHVDTFASKTQQAFLTENIDVEGKKAVKKTKII